MEVIKKADIDSSIQISIHSVTILQSIKLAVGAKKNSFYMYTCKRPLLAFTELGQLPGGVGGSRTETTLAVCLLYL